ncbi:transposable element Tc3 transposase [Trichonephila clavipes]|nr:transposable element Tc3 transposase [Trichonephila clavipes]
MEFLTFWKIPGMSRILPAAADSRAMRSSTEGKDYLCISFQKKKSIHDRSGDLEPRHVGTTCSGYTAEQHVLRQEVKTEMMQEDPICPTMQWTGRREAGWSNRRIGRYLGRSDMVVARCWQQWITEGRVYRRGGSGCPRNTNDREDRAIRRVATSAPTTSLASIQRHLPASRHPVPSRETIRRRLTEVGLRSRRPLRRLPLTPHHRQCQLDF